MEKENRERRRHYRCLKDVGVRCTRFSDNVTWPVRLRNFSSKGLYFESGWEIQPGDLVVVRDMTAHESSMGDSGPDALRFTIDSADPDACTQYRSHSLAKVTRCETRPEGNPEPLYGIGAEIQNLEI